MDTKKGKDRCDILMLSFSDVQKEGRCLRAFNALSKVATIFLFDVSDSEYKSSNHISIKKNDQNWKNFVSYSHQAINIAKGLDFKVLYASNYFTALAAIVIKLFTKCKIIYDAYELYYPEGEPCFSLRDRFFYLFEKRIIKMADVVISANESRALIMMGHFRLKKEPITIENISGTYGQLKKPKEIHSPVQVVYAGYISRQRGLEELCDAVLKIRKNYKVNLDIYGSGIDMKWCKEFSYAHKMIRYRGGYENKELSRILSKYDIGFIYYPTQGVNNIYCAPNKLYDYFYSGLPIVGNDNKGLIKLTSHLKVGCCHKVIYCALLDVIENYSIYAQNAFQFSNINLSLDIEKRIQNIYSNLTK